MNKEDGLFTYEEVSRLAKRLEEETIETRCELTKYKRAFEILKEIFDIRFEKDAFGDCWIKIFPTTYDDRHILGEPTKEQYELLEELMKGEEDK